METELDEIDKYTLTSLAKNARKVTATEIAEGVNVSPGTIRNRIRKMEEEGVIEGYDVVVDYEKLDKKFINLFKCSSPKVSSRDAIAKKSLEIDGVVNVRKLTSGREDLHIKAVARDISSLNEIAGRLEEIGLDVVDESLLDGEYSSFPVLSEKKKEPVINLRKLDSGAEIVDLSVSDDSVVVGKTLEEAKEKDVLPEELLVITIERDGNLFTPRGDTVLRAGDIVSVFSTKSIKNKLTKLF